MAFQTFFLRYLSARLFFQGSHFKYMQLLNFKILECYIAINRFQEQELKVG